MISYKDSGVDKKEGYKAVDLIKEAVGRTHGLGVLEGLGSFGAMFELPTQVKIGLAYDFNFGVGQRLTLAGGFTSNKSR